MLSLSFCAKANNDATLLYNSGILHVVLDLVCF